MKYVVQPKKNPQDREIPAKFYAVAKSVGSITFNDIAKEIEKRSSLTRGDINNVLSNLVDVIPLFLKNGNTVRLGDFGSFHLTIQSKGKDTPEEVNAKSVIKVKTVFVSGTGLKKEMEDMPIERFPE